MTFDAASAPVSRLPPRGVARLRALWCLWRAGLLTIGQALRLF
jgi:hypothetical protein